MNIEDLRREYTGAGIDCASVAEDPVAQFEAWFAQAQAGALVEPNAMSLATADAHGRVSVRTVLLKDFDARGFVFFTNLGSRKARQIGLNPRVALLFAWVALERQVEVEGTATRVSAEEALAYFHKRPRASQIGAWASRQSEEVASRGVLEERFAEFERRFSGREVPLPEFWGGFRVRPERFEFWQGRPGRLHDRCEYLRRGDAWQRRRLAP